ncbi:MAG: hypothetical protein H0V02_04785 [Nocardioidaceae bacterium]|nr:hypothetical protein [Nocardioidaceae bacterium]
MTQQLREALERATELAPTSEVDPDAIWVDARRANRNSRVLLVVASLVIAVVAGGAVWRGADFLDSVQPAQPVTGPPSYEESMLGFPDDLWSIPAGMPTTAAEGPIGPLALVSYAEHQGFWPWSDGESMVYGVSAVTGEYRFLSLPGWSPSRDPGLDEFVVMSPDGASLAYPHWNPALDNWPKYDGLTVYDTVTDEARVHTVDSPHGIDFTWMEWSPDSTQLMLGLLSNDDGNTPEYMTGRVMDAARYDVSSDSFEVIPDSEQLSSLSPTSWKPPSADANNGPVIPPGLVEHDGRVLRVLDPLTASEIASFRLDESADFDEEIWNQDGTRFVASATSGCGPGCRGGQPLVVTGELDSERAEVAIEVIARASGKLMRWRPLGWNGDDRIVGRNGINYESWFELGDSSSHRQLLSVDKTDPEEVQLFNVAADALRGHAIRGVEPVAPWGFLGLAVGVGGLVVLMLEVFALRSRMRRLRTPNQDLGAMADFVWRRDAASALVLIATIFVAFEIVWLIRGSGVSQPGLSTPVFAIVMMFMLWRVWRRGQIARFPLFMLTGLLTAIATLAVLNAAVNSPETISVLLALGAVGGLVSTALLLSPAVVDHVRGLDVIPEQKDAAGAQTV